MDGRYKNNNKRLIPKQELNISIYLSNEEGFTPQLLDMFCKIPNTHLTKKDQKIDESEMKNDKLLTVDIKTKTNLRNQNKN